MSDDESSSIIQRVLQTPCYRSSFMYGIGGGMTSGLLYFLFTSKSRTATHFGFASYICISLTAWTYCRYQMVMAQEQQRQFKTALQERLLAEGTQSELPQSFYIAPPGAQVDGQPVLQDVNSV